MGAFAEATRHSAGMAHQRETRGAGGDERVQEESRSDDSPLVSAGQSGAAAGQPPESDITARPERAVRSSRFSCLGPPPPPPVGSRCDAARKYAGVMRAEMDTL